MDNDNKKATDDNEEVLDPVGQATINTEEQPDTTEQSDTSEQVIDEAVVDVTEPVEDADIAQVQDKVDVSVESHEPSSEAATVAGIIDDTSIETSENTTDKPASEEKRKPKTVWYGLVAGLVLLFGGVGAFLTLINRNETAPMASQETAIQVPQPVTSLGAEVALAEGVVEISRDGGETWNETPGSESVANLDYVRTLDDSRAIILFDDGSVARIDNNSQIYLSSLERVGLEITLVEGQVYTRIVDSEVTPFTVITSNDKFTSLGTAFKTSTDGENDQIDVYQSVVKVVSEDIEITEGNKYNTETKTLSAIDLDELQDDEFAQWNKEKDSAVDEFKDKLGVLNKEPEEKDEQTESQPNPQPQSAQAGISLSAKKLDSSVELSWKLSGATSKNGFKIVRGTNSTPTYRTNDAQYVSADKSSHKWWDDNGGTFFYRVCIYRENGTCDTYSNAVQVTSPKVEKEAVKSGDITLEISGKKLSWSLVGGNAPHGFKIVMSDSKLKPVYPEDSELYEGPKSSSVTIQSPKRYIRICKYNPADSNCVDYSNHIEYNVSE